MHRLCLLMVPLLLTFSAAAKSFPTFKAPESPQLGCVDYGWSNITDVNRLAKVQKTFSEKLSQDQWRCNISSNGLICIRTPSSETNEFLRQTAICAINEHGRYGLAYEHSKSTSSNAREIQLRKMFLTLKSSPAR